MGSLVAKLEFGGVLMKDLRLETDGKGPRLCPEEKKQLEPGVCVWGGVSSFTCFPHGCLHMCLCGRREEMKWKEKPRPSPSGGRVLACIHDHASRGIGKYTGLN